MHILLLYSYIYIYIYINIHIYIYIYIYIYILHILCYYILNITIYYIPHLSSLAIFIKTSRLFIHERTFFTEVSSVVLKTIIKYIKLRGKVRPAEPIT